MKNRNIHDRRIIPALLIALGFGCLSLSPAVRGDGDPSILGLWRVHYFVGAVEIFQSFDQWHSDGQEFEAANLALGAICQGVFKQTANANDKLFHVGWNFDQNGVLTGYFEETQINTVSDDGNTYHSTNDLKNYDMSGNFLSEITGTQRATRLSVH
jgi:hypothetical protein